MFFAQEENTRKILRHFPIQRNFQNQEQHGDYVTDGYDHLVGHLNEKSMTHTRLIDIT